MNACLAATCIVVGLGSLFNCCTAAWCQRKEVGVVNAATLVFGGMVEHARTLQSFADNKFYLTGNKAWNHFNQFGTHHGNFSGFELANRYKNASFLAVYLTLFTEMAKQYNAQEVLDTVQAFSLEQFRTFVTLLFFVIAGDGTTINFNKYRAFVKYCLGGVPMTEEEREDLDVIFAQVHTIKPGEWNIDEFLQVIDCPEALGNQSIAAKECIHKQELEVK